MKNLIAPAVSRFGRLSRVVILALPALVLAGCEEYPRRVVVEAPPPPLQEQVIPAAPGPGYVWMQGHWMWRHRHYVWMGGHWAYAPHPGAVWMPGHWENRAGNYVYVDGYWN